MRGRRWAEDEAVREGPQMVGRLDGQKERKRGLAQPARPLGGGRSQRKGAWGLVSLLGIEESIRRWEPSATNASDALRHCTPTTEPIPDPLRSCFAAFSSLQLVQLPTHNPPMRSSRRANLIALTRASSIRRVFHVVREMSRNCRNCAQERALGKQGTREAENNLC